MAKEANKIAMADRLARAREGAKKEWGARGWQNLSPEMRKAYVALYVMYDLGGIDPQYPPQVADVLELVDVFVRGEE
jgi:hypothetical protein